MGTISLEQPPFGDDQRMISWVSRIMNQIATEFDRVNNLEPQGYLPEKMQDGLYIYFSDPVLPEIPEEGAYMYTNGAWLPMTQTSMVVPQLSALPLAPVTGQMAYFTVEILPEIATPGPYIVIEDLVDPLILTWTKMV